MKKILIFCVCFILLVGCGLSNSPTSKVESLLGKYQGLDNNIDYDYTLLALDNDLEKDIVKQYNDLIKRQYRNLVYEIKDEFIDGDIATVTVEIEVFDYKKVFDSFNNDLSHRELIRRLNDVSDKVTYTVDFDVYRESGGAWKLENLTMEENQKLLGIY